MFRIKVCGITNLDDALLAAEAGADAIGLNFYQPSPRYVAPEAAAEIVERLREEDSAQAMQIVAVFVNAALDDILWTIREANLYGPQQNLALQLHGDEPPELLAGLRSHGLGVTDTLLQATGHVPTVPIIRAFRCRETNLQPARDYLQVCRRLNALPQAVLLDGFSAASYGGTGATLDWQAVAGRGEDLAGLPLVLAGGLSSANVAAAIAAARPQAVDVASGVESSPGKKDAAKVMAFVAAARRAFGP